MRSFFPRLSQLKWRLARSWKRTNTVWHKSSRARRNAWPSWWWRKGRNTSIRRSCLGRNARSERYMAAVLFFCCCGHQKPQNSFYFHTLSAPSNMFFFHRPTNLQRSGKLTMPQWRRRRKRARKHGGSNRGLLGSAHPFVLGPPGRTLFFLELIILPEMGSLGTSNFSPHPKSCFSKPELPRQGCSGTLAT